MTFASLPRRLAASMLDLGLAALAAWAAVSALGSIAVAEKLWIALGAIAGFQVLCALGESSKWRTTPGKWALDLWVVDDDGARIGFGRALERNAAKWLPIDLANAALWTVAVPRDGVLEAIRGSVIVAAYGLLGASVMAMWLGRYRQSVHDLICDTLVLGPRRSARVPPCPVKGLDDRAPLVEKDPNR